MIVVRIFGGLGNQMFQFAAARSLARSRGVPLRLDVGDFEVRSMHQGFSLHHAFGHLADLVQPEELRSVLGWRAPGWIRRTVARRQLGVLRSRGFVVEPHVAYWHGISNVPSVAYLSGYWQSENYFMAHAETIKQDFVFREGLSARNFGVLADTGGAGAVSLHIRRGDYVTNKRALATHGVCSAKYYEAAICFVSERVSDARFFVFSDDMDWAKANLPPRFRYRFVDHNRGSDSFRDMQLMASCKHHVVANSSFSWWAAWLGAHPEKIVVAPRQWFSKPINDGDLVPSRWERL